MKGGLLMNGKDAAAYLGLGRDRFKALVKAGIIPQWRNPAGGWPLYSKPVLDAWAAGLGRDGAA